MLLLREMRDKAGLTQAALAERVGRNRDTIRRWEKGETEPRMSELLLLSKEIGCDVNDFQSLDPTPPPAGNRRGRKRAGKSTSTP